MPLYRRKRVALVLPPEPREGEEDAPCWMIRFTGEVFRSYDEYLARYQFYRKPVWQCEHTGKQCLTYEQALDSEQRSRRAVEERLPSHGLRRAVLKLVQFQTARIDALVDEAFAKLHDRYFIDEPLVYQSAEGASCVVRVLQVLPRQPRTSLQHILNGVQIPSPPPDELDLVDASEVEYRVQTLDNYPGQPSELIVDGVYLSRQRQTFTKQLLRQFIRDAATKETYYNAPWLVKKEIAHAYGLPTQMPRELAILRDEAAKKKPKKKILPDVLQPADDRIERRGTPEKRQAEEYNAFPEKRLKESLEDKVRYPIEDLHLDASMMPQHEVTVSGITEAWFPDLFETWSFLTTFGTALELMPFALDDLRLSVLHNAVDPPCRLTAATYASLLHCAAADRDVLIERRDESAEEEDEDEDDDDDEEDDGENDDDASSAKKEGADDVKTANGTDKSARMDMDTSSDGDTRQANGVHGSSSLLPDPLESLELHKISNKWWQDADDEQYWEARLLGCIQELASEDVLPGYTEIAGHLVTIGVSPDDLSECYVTLKPEQKLAIYRWLIDLIVDCSVIRDGLDTSSDKLTELRKERLDLGREMKRITALRMEVYQQQGTDSDSASANGDRDETPFSLTADSAHDSDDASGLTARQARLRVKNLEHKLKEAQRQREVDKAREEQRYRRKLDDDERGLLRKRDRLERSINRCLTVRATPLGRDRWYRRYWYLAHTAGEEAASTNGRVYIQPPMQDESAALIATPALTVRWQLACATVPADRWSYIDHPDQLDQLIRWLDVRGERELGLRRAIEKQQTAIVQAMEVNQQQTAQEQNSDDQHSSGTADGTRRSLRNRQVISHQASYLNYTNRWAKSD